MLTRTGRGGIGWLAAIVAIGSTNTMAQLTDPCEQQGCEAQEATAGPQDNDFEATWVDVGDIDGDGTADYAMYDPDVRGASIQVFSAESDSLLLELWGGGTDAHWVSIMDAGDINADGVPEISAAVVYGVPSYLGVRIAVYDGTDAHLFAYLIPIESPDGSYSLNPVLLADLNASAQVDTTDAVMMLEAIAAGSSNPAMDLNSDLIVDEQDMMTVLSEFGATPTGGQYDFSGLINTILSSEGAVDDPAFESVFADNRGASAEVQAGIFGCFFCLIKCHGAMSQAWDCRRRLWEAKCACYCDKDGFPLDPNSLEVTECLEDVRQNFLTQCLQDVAATAGSCGKCILKCGPKPTG